jgi:hypothetical protein
LLKTKVKYYNFSFLELWYILEPVWFFEDHSYNRLQRITLWTNNYLVLFFNSCPTLLSATYFHVSLKYHCFVLIFFDAAQVMIIHP